MTTDAGSLDASGLERRALWSATSVGSLLAVALVMRIMSVSGWDPAVFVKVGEIPAEFAAYAEQQLGDVPLAIGRGHDGKFYFIQALDPLFLEDPEQLRSLLDSPAYRAQRMLYPLLSGGFGLLPARATVWGLLAVNLLSIALGCWATGKIASTLGSSPWAGLIFALNPGMIFEVLLDGAGVLAWALATAGLLAVYSGRRGAALALLTAAVLTRETMLIPVVGASLYGLHRTGRVPWRLVLVPAVSALAWAIWTRFRLGTGPYVEGMWPHVDAPFTGLAKVWPVWLARPGLGLVMGVTSLVLAVYLLLQLQRLDHPYAWATAAVIVLIPLISAPIWQEAFNSSRALAPVLNGGAVALAVSLRAPAYRSRQ